MSADNGGRILLHGRRPMGKGGDFVTRAELEQLVTAECAKVHNFYMNQIPKFTATMIQDALVGYGLLTIVPPPDSDAPTGAQAVPLEDVDKAPEPTQKEDVFPGGIPAGTPCGTEPSAT